MGFLVAILGLAGGWSVSFGAEPPEIPSLTAIPAATPPEAGWYAGRLAVFGTRKIPFLGKVEFRNDNYLMARIRREGGALLVEQHVCKVVFEKVAGAKVRVKDPAATRKMPIARPIFQPQADGTWHAPSWPSGWNEDDHDGDGNGGIAFAVESGICGGTLHMASQARSEARLIADPAGWVGRIQVTVDQILLGVEGACLKLVSKGHRQAMNGYLAYTEVPADSTCDSVAEALFRDPVPLGEPVQAFPLVEVPR